jgi:hypothetical protein
VTPHATGVGERRHDEDPEVGKVVAQVRGGRRPLRAGISMVTDDPRAERVRTASDE